MTNVVIDEPENVKLRRSIQDLAVPDFASKAELQAWFSAYDQATTFAQLKAATKDILLGLVVSQQIAKGSSDMPIDPTKPVDGVTAIKADLRANLLAARTAVTTLDSTNNSNAITVNSASFGDSVFVRVRCTSSSAIAVTLASDVPAGRALEVVQYGTGMVTVAAGAGATLVKVFSASPSTTSQYEPLVFEVDTNTGTNAAWRLVARS